MNKFAFTLFLSICFLQLKAQNKQDTQEWIEIQLDRHSIWNRPEFEKPFKFKFVNNKLWIINNSIVLKNACTIIPFKDVKDIAMEPSRAFNCVRISIKIFDKHTQPIISGVITNSKFEKSMEWIGYTIEIELSSEKENIPNRLLNAMKHLVKLEGGKIVSDTF